MDHGIDKLLINLPQVYIQHTDVQHIIEMSVLL